MIELRDDVLRIAFPGVAPEARLEIELQRTLRIPDDERDYPLPPGLGRFPLRHVDDFGGRVPEAWRRRGGVLLPMYQAEAMWLRFHSPSDYPFAVKVATGKVNALTGAQWSEPLRREPQDYLVVPGQPWLDGYCVERGVIRQFVAAPLGAGVTVEEQLSGGAEFGGLQLLVRPLKRAAWQRLRSRHVLHDAMRLHEASPDYSMGLAAGGRMRQEVYADTFSFDAWETGHASRCFLHLANALQWRAVTGDAPPTRPPTAEDYTHAGLPWFEYYDLDRRALEGAPPLQGLLPYDGGSVPAGPRPVVVPLAPPGRRVREEGF